MEKKDLPLLQQEEIVRLQPRGLLTIPKKFRQGFGFTEDSFIRIKPEKGRLILEPVCVLPYPVRSYSDADLEDYFELDEKETKRIKSKGLL